MPCGAILYFDDATDSAIRGLWQVIEDAGLPSMMPGLNYPPHLTMAVCEDMDFDTLRSRLIRFVAEHPPMPVNFSGLGYFGGKEPVIYLTVTPDRSLLDFHASFEEQASRYLIGENPYYRPGMWVPHVTLNQGYPRELTGAVFNALARVTIPQRGLLRELLLVDFTPERPGLTEMFKARLGQYL